MANEQKLTQEQIEEIKKAAVAEALAAQQTANAEGSGDSEKTEDSKNPGFFTKIKEGASKAINHKFSIKDVVIAAGVVTAGVFGIKYAYEKGVADGRSESEFEGTVALPDNGTEPLALETTAQPQEAFQATVSDLTDNFEVTEVEEL